jgi:calcium-dependent protein kinase
MGCIPQNRKVIVTEGNNSIIDVAKNGSIKREISLKINSSVFIKEINENPFEQYELINKLGEGGYGKVYKVKHKKTAVIRAMKIINKYKDKTQLDLYEDIEIENLKIKVDQRKYEDDRFLKEIEILKKLDHPNIMRIYEFYNREHRFYLICEYIEGEELFEKITASKYFNEEMAATYMHQILSGVNYLHKMGIIHRDLKPENILVEDSDKDYISLKIIDFGTSAMITPNEKLTKKTGTSFYIAPEVLQGKYDEKCDIWSCGIIMYILLCGGPPFNGSNNNEIFSAILEETLVFKGEIWRYISDEAMKLIKNMLQKKPEKRLTASEILQSKWFTAFPSRKESYFPNVVSNGEDVKVVSVVENLRAFKAEKKLQQAVLSFLIHDLSTNKEIQFLKKLFCSIDKDFDGKLSKIELHDFMYKYCGADLNAEVDLMFNNMDADKNGAIEFEEFLIASMNKNKIINENNLKQAFDRFDFDRNGKIDAKELKKIFQTLNGAVDESVWANLICKADVNGDGEIDFDEFKAMMNFKSNKLILK